MVATPILQRFSTKETLTVTNLHSLANDSFWQSAAFTLTDKPFDILILTALSTNTSVGSASGYARAWLAPSLDGTTFAGDASGTEGSYAPTTPSAAEQSKNLIPLGIVQMKADETMARVYEKIHSALAALKGAMPYACSLVIQNKTGQAFASSNNLVEVRCIASEFGT